MRLTFHPAGKDAVSYDIVPGSAVLVEETDDEAETPEAARPRGEVASQQVGESANRQAGRHRVDGMESFDELLRAGRGCAWTSVRRADSGRAHGAARA